MAGSGNAKRRQAQQRRARRSADRSHQRERQQPHEHLPKVGTRKEQAYLRRQRQADLFDFGRIGVGRAVAIGLAVLAVVALGLFLLFN